MIHHFAYSYHIWPALGHGGKSKYITVKYISFNSFGHASQGPLKDIGNTANNLFSNIIFFSMKYFVKSPKKYHSMSSEFPFWARNIKHKTGVPGRVFINQATFKTKP